MFTYYVLTVDVKHHVYFMFTYYVLTVDVKHHVYLLCSDCGR